MYYFCTYFDHNYLCQGLALHQSLQQHCKDFQLYVLCLSKECYEILSTLSPSQMILLKLEDFEAGDGELLKAKSNRSLVEYYFTCTPSLPLYILKNNPRIDMITYVDADLYFYNDPKPVFQEMVGQSIGIIAHRYPDHYKAMEVCGVYNVGWLSFSNDDNSISCLKWWRDRCIEWCYKRVEGDKFADQKYLDDWAKLFKKVRVIQHKGANLATWNIENYKVKFIDDRLWIDNEELIFFHFHGLRRLTNLFYCVGYHQTKINRVIRKKIFKPYFETLREINSKLIKSHLEAFVNELFLSPHMIDSGNIQKIKTYLSVLYRILLSGNYIAIPPK